MQLTAEEEMADLVRSCLPALDDIEAAFIKDCPAAGTTSAATRLFKILGIIGQGARPTPKAGAEAVERSRGDAEHPVAGRRSVKEKDMTTRQDSFFINIDTQEPVRVVWRVHMMMPIYISGTVDIEATTHQEAAQLALQKDWTDMEWDFDGKITNCGLDDTRIEVAHVECVAPPVDAVLICRGCNTGASLDALFEPDDPTTAPETQNQAKADDADGNRIV